MGDGTGNVGLGMLNTSGAFRQRRLPRPAASAGSTSTPEEWGLREENAHRPDARRRAADGLQPHSRTTTAACCWSATPAAWSTRSTARASPTPWSPASSPPRRRRRRWPARRVPARERALHAYPTRADGRVRRLLHARRHLREADRQARRHAAATRARAAAPDADALHAEAAGQPHRPARTATRWTGSSTALTRIAPAA